MTNYRTFQARAASPHRRAGGVGGRGVSMGSAMKVRT